MPLALRYPPDQRFDTFVGAPAGALAQLRALAAGDGDWLYLDGGPGTGKTHLLLAACAEAESRGASAVYLPMAAAVGRLALALDGLQAMHLVALDGLEAIAGDRGDEVALFDFHNRARAAGVAVLYAADAAPAALPLGLADLRSRLAQCARITLQPLDDAGRAEVLRLRARRRGLQFDEAAIGWLLKRAGRDLAGLTAQLDALDRASLAAQRRVTVPFLREVLGSAGG
nr:MULTISPECIES: DnaA regulatory inactivator Hda [unclassified Luteimonas]